MKKLCDVCKSRILDLEKDDYMHKSGKFICIACHGLITKIALTGLISGGN